MDTSSGKHSRIEDQTSRSGGRFVVAVSLLLILISAALSIASRTVSGFAQWYAVTVYPILQSGIGHLTGFIPFSVSEALCILLPFLIIADLIVNRHKLRRSAKHLLLLISVLFFLYSACCGVNYYRDPFVSADDYSQAKFTEKQLYEFCEHAVSQLSDCYDESGSPVEDYPGWNELSQTARESMISLSRDYDSLEGFYPRPKSIRILAPFFSMMGVSGIYSPFTVEANVNGEMEGMEKPFSACHELSHLRGYMNEGEANYIGWLACISSQTPAFRRSGWLIAWSYAGSSLWKTSPDDYSKLREKLPDGAVRELESNHIFWSSRENRASEIQDHINDAYLRSNGQDEGIVTYNHLTTLMLMWYYSGSQSSSAGHSDS